MGVRLRKDESHLLPFRVFQARPSCRVLGENRFLNCAKGSPNFKPLKSARATSASHDCAAAVPDKASKIKHNIRFMVIFCPVRFMWIIQIVSSFFYIQLHTAAGVFQTAFLPISVPFHPPACRAGRCGGFRCGCRRRQRHVCRRQR